MEVSIWVFHLNKTKLRKGYDDYKKMFEEIHCGKRIRLVLHDYKD